MARTALISLALFLVQASLPAQTYLGYGANTPLVRVAPGQLITLFVDARGVQLDGAVEADSIPLPREIEGFGVVGVFRLGVDSTGVYAVRPGEGGKIAVTAQVPFYGRDNWPRALGVSHPNGSVPRCSIFGPCEAPQEVAPARSAIHILNACDSFFGDTPASECEPLVTHAGGELVSYDRPPLRGETLVAYATGLGMPTVLDDSQAFNLVTGVVTATRGCAPMFYQAPPPHAAPAEFAALLHPSIGIYQINFRVGEPDAPSDCDGPPGSEIVVGRVIDGVVDSFDVIRLPPIVE